MATASRRLTRKLLIAVVTASDCMATTPNSMPSGICGFSSCRRTFRPSPIVTTLPPGTVDTPSPMAG